MNVARLHVVPTSRPNANARPIIVELRLETVWRLAYARGWTAVAELLEPHVPDGYFMVRYDLSPLGWASSDVVGLT